MKRATTSAVVPLHGVATPGRGPVDSPRCCGHCGKAIPRPRPGQRACTPRCRFQLWKAAQRAPDLELRIGLMVLRGLVDDLLARVERRRG